MTAPASGAWAGLEGALAVQVGGAWRFIAPAEGMVIFDRATGRLTIFRSQWQPAALVPLPTGGTVIDTEARAAITTLVAALQTMGVVGVQGG